MSCLQSFEYFLLQNYAVNSAKLYILIKLYTRLDFLPGYIFLEIKKKLYMKIFLKILVKSSIGLFLVCGKYVSGLKGMTKDYIIHTEVNVIPFLA